MCVQFLKGLPPKFWDGQKTSKFRRDLSQLSTLIANVSRSDRHVEHLKKLDQPQPLPRWVKKLGELWSTSKKVLVAHIDQHKWAFFWRLLFGHYVVLLLQIFTRVAD